MKHLQKVEFYQNVALNLSEADLNKIRQYYSDWEIGDQVNLKHRYVKIFGLNKKNNSAIWIRLDKYFNKRRVSNDELGGYIRKLLDGDFYPIRIFHGVSEWLDPRAVIHSNVKTTRMIASGILVFESDDSLEESIICAQQVDEILLGKKLFVFSGNQSIHVWYFDFNPLDYLDISEAELYSRREYYDRVARYNLYEEIQEKVKFVLDKRVTIDSRRVVPIIGSLNALTFRRVVLLDTIDINSQKVLEKSSF